MTSQAQTATRLSWGATSRARRRCTEPSCWFEDGNVVLEAQYTVFKVYKGLLSQESEVFKSMFALPQPSSGSSELYDGCPLVVLQDSAVDVQAFIQAIFDLTFLTKRLDRGSTCASLLNKYQAQRLRQRVMAPLSRAFPDTLAGYRATVISSNGGPFGLRDKSPLTWDWNERAAVANAARQSGTSILLPTFLLSSCLHNVDDVLRMRALGEADRHAILAAMPKLSVAAREEVYAPLFSSDRDLSPNCTQPAKCYQGRHARMKELEEYPNFFNPFHNLATGLFARDSRFCQSCTARIADADQKMQALWERLPSIFGLGSWDELRKAEKNAAASEFAA